MYTRLCRQYESGVLSLVELSLDVNLASNALRLIFGSPTTVLLANDIHEQEDLNVVITFSTTVAVYRLVLPHPETISKVSSCCRCIDHTGVLKDCSLLN